MFIRVVWSKLLRRHYFTRFTLGSSTRSLSPLLFHILRFTHFISVQCLVDFLDISPILHRNLYRTKKKSFIRSQWLLSSRQKTSSPTNKWELKPDKWQWIVSIRRMNEWMAKHDVRCWFSLHLLSFLHFFFVFFLVSHRCLVCLKMIQNCGENITICCDAEHYKAIQMYQCWNHAISCWLFLSCRSSCEAEEKVSI